MFRWYRDADRCYVYLSDVCTPSSLLSRNTALELSPWQSQLQGARWFSRGWTLQELLAPHSVEFFSEDGSRIGDKKSLEKEIRELTGIHRSALRGTPLSQFSIDERLSWIEGRKTKLEEDKAYSLLGIFNIYMPLIYGEGGDSAFRRLREEVDKSLKLSVRPRALSHLDKEDQECIKSLRLTDPRDDKKRIEETKGGLLEDSYHWILDHADFQQWQQNDSSQLLWVKGDPGKGKTMLLCGIIDELKKSTTSMISFFFCQATDSRINKATAVLRGILYMLVDQQPSLLAHFRKKYDHAGQSLFQDANSWVALSEILTDVLQDPGLGTAYLIIDALDECTTDLPKLLQFIAQQPPSPIKWIVSSRNWPDIEEQLGSASHMRLSLELNSEAISKAVSIFIQQKVAQVAQQKRYDKKTREAVLNHLTLNSDDTFLWVALVCQNLKFIPRWNVSKKLGMFPPGLDSLYGRMMQQINNNEDADVCKHIIAIIAAVYRPVTLAELATLAEELEDIADEESIREIVSLCGSFLTMREDIIYFVHQSARDFLFTKVFDEIFSYGFEFLHSRITSRSLYALSKTLRRNLYNLPSPACSAECHRERSAPLDLDPLAGIRYSCIYWIDHLCESGMKSSAGAVVNLSDGGPVDLFMRKHFLHWLEALSLCNCMSKGMASITRLEALAAVQENALTVLIKDARRFIMAHKEPIGHSPLQTYASALLFSPVKSLIRSLFRNEEPKWVTVNPPVRDEWSACLQTLYGHHSPVDYVAISHDSTILASSSYRGSIKIWDMANGVCLRTLDEKSSGRSVAFSHNSTRLVSTSIVTPDSPDVHVFKIWDVNSGSCVRVFTGYRDTVMSISISRDSKRLGWASNDHTVKVWDMNGTRLHILMGHEKSVSSVEFSKNSSHLASASDDGSIRIWDVDSGACLQTLNGHQHSVTCVTFSHDSMQLASASTDDTIKIWDAKSGMCLQTFGTSGHGALALALSQDLTQLAAASNDSIIRIWDLSSGSYLQKLEGHGKEVSSVAYSHDSTRLVTASWDATIKIWDIQSITSQQIRERHGHSVKAVGFSQDLKQLVSTSSDGAIRIWDANSGTCQREIRCESGRLADVAFSHDAKKLLLVYFDSLETFDVNTGAVILSLSASNRSAQSDAFCHESTQIAVPKWGVINIWDMSRGAWLQTFEGHSSTVTSVVFSHDSRLLASGSFDQTIKIWDVSNGECLQTLRGHCATVQCVTFSHDSTMLASSSENREIKIWNSSSGECTHTYRTNDTVKNMAFDSVGRFLCIETDNIAASIYLVYGPWDGKELFPLDYEGTGVSTTGEWLTYDGCRIIWLPSEYRPVCATVSAHKVAIGVGSGRVWICNFDPSQSGSEYDFGRMRQCKWHRDFFSYPVLEVSNSQT